jgi:hypothetical protein
MYIVQDIPISWALEGHAGSPPMLTTLDYSPGRIAYRDFTGAFNTQVIIPWLTPYGLDDTVLPVFAVDFFITNAGGIAAGATLKFNMIGSCLTDGDLLDETQTGSVTVTWTCPVGGLAQYKRSCTAWSGNIAITGFSAAATSVGSLIDFTLTRDTTDTYANAIGVTFLKLKYKLTPQSA